jgi:hypothetical protein
MWSGAILMKLIWNLGELMSETTHILASVLVLDLPLRGLLWMLIACV